MHSLFHSHEPDPPPVVEPVPTLFPAIQGAQIAAKFVGQRVAGDFYDSIRVGPERVLIGLLDAAGRRDDNRLILATAQRIFRESGAQLFSKPDLNESEALTELNLLINRGLIDGSTSVRSCPAFIACYHEQFGTLCYVNAGHPPALLRDHTGVIELTSTGLPLGLFLSCHRRRPHRRHGERFRPGRGFPRSRGLPSRPRRRIFRPRSRQAAAAGINLLGPGPLHFHS